MSINLRGSMHLRHSACIQNGGDPLQVYRAHLPQPSGCTALENAPLRGRHAQEIEWYHLILRICVGVCRTPTRSCAATAGTQPKKMRQGYGGFGDINNASPFFIGCSFDCIRVCTQGRWPVVAQRFSFSGLDRWRGTSTVTTTTEKKRRKGKRKKRSHQNHRAVGHSSAARAVSAEDVATM